MIALTPQRLEAVYHLFLDYPHFKSLPPAEEVEFHVYRHPGKFADFSYNGRGIIRVSDKTNGSLDTLTRTMAHEMVHFVLYLKGCKAWAAHGGDFHRMAGRVCKTFGWDEKAF